MKQTTTKLVAVSKHGYDNGCRSVDGNPYITWDASSAKSYSKGEKPPKGFKLRKVTYSTEVLGGGFYWHQGTTMG